MNKLVYVASDIDYQNGRFFVDYAVQTNPYKNYLMDVKQKRFNDFIRAYRFYKSLVKKTNKDFTY